MLTPYSEMMLCDFTAGVEGVSFHNLVSPKEGLIYHVRVDAAADNVVNLEATAETSRDHLRWFVDADYLGESAPSSALLWKLQPGRHVIRAVDDAGRADTRDISVTMVQ